LLRCDHAILHSFRPDLTMKSHRFLESGACRDCCFVRRISFPVTCGNVEIMLSAKHPNTRWISNNRTSTALYLGLISGARSQPAKLIATALARSCRAHPRSGQVHLHRRPEPIPVDGLAPRPRPANAATRIQDAPPPLQAMPRASLLAPLQSSTDNGPSPAG